LIGGEEKGLEGFYKVVGEVFVLFVECGNERAIIKRGRL